ncbi:TonB-dependent receptor [Chitinophaga sp. 212800010-3]|uniref:SusC/RagA family TonB-linked outer membrane protein n=1 Tax=unclassified Chitinophaga TaxID=2619133 RepID=UPI002DE2EB73|nr:Plug domain-containing protein [Chitinophaga sp. 212800010-3]
MKRVASTWRQARYFIACWFHFMILVILSAVTARAQSAGISVNLRNAPIQEFFQAVERQSDYHVIYSESVIRNARKISIDMKNAQLEKLLKAALADQPFGYRVTEKKIFIVPGKQAIPAPVRADSSTAVSGKVTAKTDGIALPGVSVKVVGTSRGTTTDADGKFRVFAEKGDSLSFSYMGYVTQVVAVENSRSLSVLLQTSDGQGLNEVVVLGFGQTQKKIAQTGATASITTKELKQSPVANITNALAGRLPGLTAIQISGEPGNDKSQLLIRGRATLNGADPLITIDGVQKDYSAISLLDANEIENITVLKDASATALYGVKGANGVIIVTTRRGKTGKPAITMSVQHAVQQSTRLPKYLNAYGYATLANEAYLNDHPGGTPPYNATALEAYRTGSDPLKYPDVDWLGEMMKPALQTQANFNISGGSRQARYFVNVGYTDQGGIYKTEKNKQYNPKSDFKRYNFRSNVDIDFDENFSMALNLYGAIENKRDPNVSVADLFWTLNQVPPNAFPVKYPTGYYGENGVFLNPARLLNATGFKESFNSSLSGMLSLTRKLNFITQGLSVKGNYSFDGYFQNGFRRDKQVKSAVYKGMGAYDDPANYSYLGNDVPLSAPVSAYAQNRDIWMDLSLNYLRNFGPHEVSGLVLANRTQKVIGNQIPFVSQGLVTRLTYNYKYKYFAEFNAGYNGTDNFSKAHRYGFFPAVSAGWILSEESFLRQNRVIDFLKLRGSYGITGNDQLSGRRWLFSSEYTRDPASGYLYGDQVYGIPGIYEGAMANPDVTWETARKFNVGFELKLLKNLITLTADYFTEKRHNILITRSSVPAIIGMSDKNLPPANMGKVNNSGFEVELGHRNTINKVTYSISGNMSYARNKVIFIDEQHRAYDYMYQTGHPLGQIMGLTAIGFFKDEMDIRLSPSQFGKVIPGDIKYKDLNGDGVIDDNDVGPIGRSNIPEIFFGIAGQVSWKNFDLSFLFQGAANSNRTMVGGISWEFYEGGKVRQEHLNRWTPATAATATWPALHYGGNSNNHRVSSFYLEDNSYVRLKNMEIGYTFRNVRLTKKASFDNCRIYANCNNLITWTRAQPILDPEYWASNTNGTIYPAQKVLNIGASVSF